MASIGELFIELGVKADTQTINKVGQGIKTLRNNLLLTAGAFVGAVAGIDRFVNSSLKGVVALQNLNAQTGLSIEKLQQFQQAGQLSNLALSADQIANSIANVQKNIAQIKIGQGNIAPFQLLGVDVKGQDAFGVIDQLRDSLKGIDPAIATNLISQIGLTPDFVNLLKISRKEFEALSQNTFLSKSQRGDIDKVGTSIKALTLRFKALKDQAVAKIAPALNEIVEKFFKWLKDNGDKVISAMSGIAKSVARFAQAIGNALDVSSRFLEKIVGVENGVKALAATFGFLALSFSPFLAGLAAVILLLDDIAVFRRGGDSLFGSLVDGFNELSERFPQLPNIAKILGGVGVAAIVLKLSSSIVKLSAALWGLKGLSLILNPLTLFLTAATAFANAPSIGAKVADFIDSKDGGKIGDFLNESFLQQGFLKGGNFFKNAFSGAGELFGLNKDVAGGESSRKDRLAIPQSSINQSSANNVFNNNVNVSGLQSPQAVGSEITRILPVINQQSLNRVQASQGRNLR